MAGAYRNDHRKYGGTFSTSRHKDTTYESVVQSETISRWITGVATHMKIVT